MSLLDYVPEPMPDLTVCPKCLYSGSDCHCPGAGSEAHAPATPPDPPPHTTLEQVHAVFRRWFGEHYDLAAIDAVLAVAATEQLDGDPPWLLLISGPGNAKTETVMALSGVTRHIISTITSEAALLSGTPPPERAKDATGGLLREIGERGLLVVKDFTSIMSMNRDLRGQVLGALREIYDGKWSRRMGGEGGRILAWTGRLVLIGAATSAYDAAHAVIAAMGDRFCLLRLDSADGNTRKAAHLQALANVGHEQQMRAELAAAVAGLLTHTDDASVALTPAEVGLLGRLADLVTLARTAVERDYRGDVIDSHLPEMPTRFAKMLAQIVRGALALRMHRAAAVAVAVRVAGDSIPPLRLAILADLLEHPDSTVTDLRKRLQRPHNTVDRECQALHAIGLAEQDDRPASLPQDKRKTAWVYRLTQRVDLEALQALVSRNVSMDTQISTQVDLETLSKNVSELSLTLEPCVLTDVSGNISRVVSGDLTSSSSSTTTSSPPSEPAQGEAGSTPAIQVTETDKTSDGSPDGSEQQPVYAADLRKHHDPDGLDGTDGSGADTASPDGPTTKTCIICARFLDPAYRPEWHALSMCPTCGQEAGVRADDLQPPTQVTLTNVNHSRGGETNGDG